MLSRERIIIWIEFDHSGEVLIPFIGIMISFFFNIPFYLIFFLSKTNPDNKEFYFRKALIMSIK